MTNEKAVAPVGLVEVGTMFAQGLQFMDNDIEATLSKVVAKHAGRSCQLKPARPAIAANEAEKIEARPAEPAVEIILGEDTKQELLGAIAMLPQLRGIFTEQVAEAITEARKGDTDYEKLVVGLLEAMEAVAEATRAIKEFDALAVPGFDIDTLVTWSPVESPKPKQFLTGGVSNRNGSRKRSLVKWNLDEYTPAQTTVEGSEASYHNIRLVRTGAGWVVSSDEGTLPPQSSPNKAMREMLISAGLSPQRSANDFWNGEAQEQAAGV